jgi:hypothetical protein
VEAQRGRVPTSNLTFAMNPYSLAKMLLIRPGRVLFGLALITALCGPATLSAQAISIACGRTSAYAGSDGTVWQSDEDYVGGNRYYSGYPVTGTPDPGLYSWARVGYYGDFSYSVPVANGSYNVTLKFADLQYFSPGQRVFNVTLNGTQVLTNFDIVGSSGALVAIDKQFPVQVTNQVISITVHGVVNLGILNAIQISPSGGGSSPALQVTGGALTFSGTAGGSNPASQSVSISNAGGGTLNW